MRRTVVAFLFVVTVAWPLYAGKKKAVYGVRPGQKVELATLPAVVAKQKCDNWAWAAAFEAMLRLQGAPLDQSMWITKLDGGEVCRESVATWEDLLRALTRDYYVLDDGRKLRLDPRFVPGPPTAPDDLIMPLKRGAPPMLVWRGHAYLVAGITYDEGFGPNGTRLYEIKEMKLLDPFAAPGRPERLVTFTRDKDDAREIDGVFTVRVVWQLTQN